MKKKYLFLLSVAALGCMAVMSCSSDEAAEDIGTAKHVVNMLTEPQPIKLTEPQRQFSTDNNQFTLNFLSAVNQFDRSGESFIYSPLSIAYVLSMVNDAATGETGRELEQTLGFHEGGIQAVNDYCKALIDGLPKVDEKVTLNIANAIFLSNHYKLKEQFQLDMQQYFDAKAEILDFASPKSPGHINDWCRKQTNNMIPSIVDQLNPDAVTYLLNAIYFKADWASKFDPKNTKSEAFATAKGKVQVPMMHQNVLISYLHDDVLSAVIIPYGSGLWNMTVLLPEEGKSVDDVIEHLRTNRAILDSRGLCTTGGPAFYGHEVDLKLPRFETTSDTGDLGDNALVQLLQQMGIRRAFDSNLAEIPNMANVPVHISMMRQKAAIKVNEEGSEAAAVTVGQVNTTSAGPADYPKATFHANRPFVYVISEQSSGVILFVGKFSPQAS